MKPERTWAFPDEPPNGRLRDKEGEGFPHRFFAAIQGHRRQVIAGATGADVKLRAERKLGGSAEALAPQWPRGVFVRKRYADGPRGGMVRKY